MSPNYNLPPGCTDRDIDRAADGDRATHYELLDYLNGDTSKCEERDGFVVLKKQTAREISLYAKRVEELNRLDAELLRLDEKERGIAFIDLTPIARRFAPKLKLTVTEEYERMEQQARRRDVIQGIVTGLVIVAVILVMVWKLRS